MFCPHCGTPLPSEAGFCPRCGGQLSAKAAPSISTPPVAAPTKKPSKIYKGLSGWLALFGFNLFLVIPFWAFYLFSAIQQLTSTDYDTLFGVRALLLFELAALALLLIAAVYLLILYSRMSKAFPRLAMVFLAGLLLYRIIDSTWTTAILQANSLDPTLANTADAWPPVAWLLYLWNSRRVKATFVN